MELVSLEPCKQKGQKNQKELPKASQKKSPEASQGKAPGPRKLETEVDCNKRKSGQERSVKSELSSPSTNEASSVPSSAPPKALNIVRSSKLRHIEGSSRDRATFITKFPSLSSTVPGDSNAFQVRCNILTKLLIH